MYWWIYISHGFLEKQFLKSSQIKLERTLRNKLCKNILKNI